MANIECTFFARIVSQINAHRRHLLNWIRSMTELFNEKLAEQKLGWLLNSAPDAMLIGDREGILVFANPQACRLFGFAADDMIGNRIGTLLAERGRHGEAGSRIDFRLGPAAPVTDGDAEVFGRHKDETEFPVEISIAPLRASKLVVVTIYDARPCKQAEAAG